MSTLQAGQPGDTITAAFTLTASADLDSRTISGTAVPYGPVGYTSWGPTVVEAGAVEMAPTVVMLADHDSAKPVGKLTAHEDTADGLQATFKIAATTRGDEILLEAAEGIRSGLSVGMQVHAYEIDTEAEVIRITRATLREVSSVVFPAFDDARVERVAAAETGTPAATPEENRSPVVDEDKIDAKIAEAIKAAQLTAAAPAAGEPEPGYIPARAQERFPYGQGVSASFVGDAFKAAYHGDVEAGRRNAIAADLMQAAAVRDDVAEIVPTAYRPELYVGQLATPRTVIDQFAKASIADATPFRIPKFVSSSGLIGTHTEGVNPVDGSVTVTDQVVTPIAMSGKYTGSRELFESASPALDPIVLGAIMEEYAIQSESYARTTFLAGATVGDLIVSNPTVSVRQRLTAFARGRRQSANAFCVGDDLFDVLVTEVDSTGRPMNPDYGPVNAAGQANGDMSLIVAGRAMPLAVDLDGLLIGVKSDAYTFESGIRTWRFEEVDGPANIALAAFGYLAAAVIRQSGLLKVALD